MNQELQEYPTYVLSADECPPGDDRRHGCGICHRRFNRPSSVLIHMNSHTGAQRKFSQTLLTSLLRSHPCSAFECPFPGCTRRFSVSSNMRRHYRNHRDLGPPDRASALIPTQSPYTMKYRAPEAPRAFYARSTSLFTSSTSSSHTGGSDTRSNIASALLDVGSSPFFASAALSRSYSDSDACPVRAPEAAPRRLRSCTVEGCDCIEAPTTLRPAVFHTTPARASVSSSAPSSAVYSLSPSTPASASPFVLRPASGTGRARNHFARR